MKRAFKVGKKTTFLLISTMLSFRHTKQTSKNEVGTFKCLLQNIYLMLNLNVTHKCNPIITTVVHGSIFQKICKTIT